MFTTKQNFYTSLLAWGSVKEKLHFLSCGAKVGYNFVEQFCILPLTSAVILEAGRATAVPCKILCIKAV